MLTKEDRTLIKNVWESKKYRVKRLFKEFPNKKCSKRGVEDFQKRLQTTRSIERAPGSGRPRTTRTAENVDTVGEPSTEAGESTPDTLLHFTELKEARSTSHK